MDGDTLNSKNDWRLRNQDEYLMNVHLVFEKFDSSLRDHDHCEFCWAKFGDSEKDLHYGYCTPDKYHWICEDCFRDFKDLFRWRCSE